MIINCNIIKVLASIMDEEPSYCKTLILNTTFTENEFQ